MAPSIVFLDELDSLVGELPFACTHCFLLTVGKQVPPLSPWTTSSPARPAGKRVEGEQTGEVTARILSSFLTELDGLELAQGVLVMGATNRVQALDAALIRWVVQPGASVWACSPCVSTCTQHNAT